MVSNSFSLFLQRIILQGVEWTNFGVVMDLSIIIFCQHYSWIDPILLNNVAQHFTKKLLGHHFPTVGSMLSYIQTMLFYNIQCHFMIFNIVHGLTQNCITILQNNLAQHFTKILLGHHCPTVGSMLSYIVTMLFYNIQCYFMIFNIFLKKWTNVGSILFCQCCHVAKKLQI